MSTPRSGRPDPSTRPSSREDRGGIDRATRDSAADRLIAAIEGGTLRAQVDATTDPEWNAKYGDNAWDAALMCIGYISPAEAEARFQKPRGKT